jgi:hypothetical protein
VLRDGQVAGYSQRSRRKRESSLHVLNGRQVHARTQSDDGGISDGFIALPGGSALEELFGVDLGRNSDCMASVRTERRRILTACSNFWIMRKGRGSYHTSRYVLVDRSGAIDRFPTCYHRLSG